MPTPPPKAAPKSHPGPLRTRTTVVKPFSFENRGFDPKAKREKLLKEVQTFEPFSSLLQFPISSVFFFFF